MRQWRPVFNKLNLMTSSKIKYPYLGFGLGLRPEHYEAIILENPAIDWFEIITENYLIPGGKPPGLAMIILRGNCLIQIEPAAL